VSKALHQQSHRFAQPFVAINCGAIPAQLLESELFGHKKGAFTGATCDRAGRFELAHNGTLFLDEIGDMPLDLQVKFLRVLEERTVQPVGSEKQIDVDVRVVAATHRDLEEMVVAGKFREDLFYRLNILPITVPPLKDRSTDISLLLAYFCEFYAEKYRPISFSPRSMHLMQSYPWPGNVRELSNFTQRMSVLFPAKKIDLGKIPDEFLPSGLIALSGQLDSLSKQSFKSESVAEEQCPSEVQVSDQLELNERDLKIAPYEENDLERCTGRTWWCASGSRSEEKSSGARRCAARSQSRRIPASRARGVGPCASR
jgi:sigma-54 specific flagellar transcriptional regulator A